jgi:hypothetical protein
MDGQASGRRSVHLFFEPCRNISRHFGKAVREKTGGSMKNGSKVPRVPQRSSADANWLSTRTQHSSGQFCPVLGLGHVGEQLNESHRRLLQSATLSLPILDRERIPHPCNSFHAIGAAGQTTARGRPDRACGNSVLPTRHLVESPDQIPGPSADSRRRPHP